MRIQYTDEFKIEVIRDYYTNDLGVRMTANKWGLPSKNYITKWEVYLKRKGLLPNAVKKPPLKAQKAHKAIERSESERIELQALRKQNEELKAALEFERELNYALGVKKKRKQNTK
jgi:transposase-like protein